MKSLRIASHYRWLVMICAGFMLAGLASAQEMSGPRAEHRLRQGGLGLGRLDLTDEQFEKLEKARIEQLREMSPLRTELRVKELELASLWRQEKLDGKKIVAKVKEISELRTKMEIARVNHRLAMYELLTPEQRKKARSFLMGRERAGRRAMRGRRAIREEPMEAPGPED